MATIFDLFEVTSISPDTTYSAAAGNLLGVVDGMSSAALDDGEFDEGDIVSLGGVSYRIDIIQEPASSGRFTLGDGSDVSFDPGAESNLSVIFLTISNGADVRHFIVPNDSYGDMNVQSIRTGSIQDVAGSDAAIISTTDNNVNVVCFVTGTLIATPSGEVRVEEIAVGDLVETRDHGPQKVRLILIRDLDFRIAPERLKPIAFERSALGPDLPNRRLCVSPQHRILLKHRNGRHVLVPAKALTARKGVRVMEGKRRTTYIHLVFDRHEIVRSNGVYTESFYPGRMALSSIPDAARAEVEGIFGAEFMDAVENEGQAAAPILSVQDAAAMARDFS